MLGLWSNCIPTVTVSNFLQGIALKCHFSVPRHSPPTDVFAPAQLKWMRTAREQPWVGCYLCFCRLLCHFCHVFLKPTYFSVSWVVLQCVLWACMSVMQECDILLFSIQWNCYMILKSLINFFSRNLIQSTSYASQNIQLLNTLLPFHNHLF